MSRSRLLAGGVALVLATARCAGVGGPERMTCALIGGTLGGVAGAVISHNTNEGETDEKLAAGAIGAVAGAALGSLLCGGDRPLLASTAQIDADPSEGNAPLRVNLAAELDPPASGPWKYNWDLGDGSTGVGQRAVHVFNNPGTYTVRMTASKPGAQNASATTRITVRSATPAREVRPEPAPPEPTRRKVVLRGVRFPYDSAKISVADEGILEVAVEELKANSGVRVKITGHTDSRGSDEYNRALSERRANAVLAYFTSHGIARQRLIASGAGESEPVASNDSEDGRAQNRRVELDILE